MYEDKAVEDMTPEERIMFSNELRRRVGTENPPSPEELKKGIQCLRMNRKQLPQRQSSGSRKPAKAYTLDDL